MRADAYLAKSYVRDTAQRMEMYKKIARIEEEDDFSDVIDELCDRFGDPPRAAMMLCRIALLRGMGMRAGITKIDEREKEVLFSLGSPDFAAIQSLGSRYPGMIRMLPIIWIQ